MEANSNTEGDVFKCTTRSNCSESSSSPDRPSTNNGLQLDDVQNKNHDLDRSVEVDRNHDRTFYCKDRENCQDENLERFNEETPQLNVHQHYMGNWHSGMMNWQENVIVGTVKEVVHLTQCVLYPPEPTRSIFTRARPPGCKTVFVGYSANKITEGIIREVFERCGEILNIRMMNHLPCKSFCYVEFASEEFVDRALHFSGYTMKIENKDEQPYIIRLHVNYAVARDDAFKFKCKQRCMQPEARHRQRQEEESCKVLTPPPIVHYSEQEATVLGEKLLSEESFQQAVCILITWLERGECNKQNAESFYSMIQSINSHVMRLMSEKVKYKNEVRKARAMLKNQMQSIFMQFNEIEKVFNTASLQKVWDHFTYGQQKNIEFWKKQTEEIKNVHVEEVLNDCVENKMDVIDDEEVKDDGTVKETPDTTSDQNNELEEDVNKLKDENDILRCQLSAAVNDMMLLRSDAAQALEFKECEIQGLMQVLTNSTNILNRKRTSDEIELKEHVFKSKRVMDKDDHQEGNNNDQSEIDNMGPFNTTSFAMCISETDAHLLGLISTFLHVHPFGANIDYICSYLHQIYSSIQPRYVESLMKRFPTIYIEELTGIGASLGKKWRFLGFQ